MEKHTSDCVTISDVMSRLVGTASIVAREAIFLRLFGFVPASNLELKCFEELLKASRNYFHILLVRNF